MFLGQCGTEASSHPFYGLPASGSGLWAGMVEGKHCIPAPWGGREIELVTLSPLYSRIEANYCCKLYLGLPVSSAALLSAALVCVPKLRGDAVKTPSASLVSAHRFSKRELVCQKLKHVNIPITLIFHSYSES